MSSLLSKISIAVFLGLFAISCNKLKHGEIAKIKYESSGCFGAYKNTITFFKKDGLSFAKLEDGDKNKIVRIDEKKIKSMNEVISSIKSLKYKEGCTRSIKYTVYTASETIEKKDEGCQKTGFERLRQELFKNSN